MPQMLYNNIRGTITASISDSDTAITVDSSTHGKIAALSAGQFIVATLVGRAANGLENQWEHVLVTSNSSNPWTVVRAFEKANGAQTAFAWTSGAEIELRTTAQTLSYLQDGAVQAGWFGMTPGSECSVALQAATDFCLFAGKQTLELPGGIFSCDETWHIGYGVDYRGITVVGQGAVYGGDSKSAGTHINFTASDRPAINIQGARITRLRGISIKNTFGDYMTANGLGGEATTTTDDVDPTLWYDPAKAATQDSQYAPWAGITIDAYSGTRPGTSYPDVTYPSEYVGTPAQYGKNFSSDVEIRDVFISGFNTAICIQPCDADGNGDFIRIVNPYIRNCKYGLSVGNKNARNTQIVNAKFTSVHTVCINNKHGKQAGKFASNIDGLQFWNCIHLFNFTGNAATPSRAPGQITFQNCYGESIYRLGTINSPSISQGLAFNACEFRFGAQSYKYRGTRASIIDGSVPDNFLMSFRDCIFQGAAFVFPILIKSATYHNCHFLPTSAFPNPFEQHGNNGTAGGLITPRLTPPKEALLNHNYFDLSTNVRTTTPQVIGRLQERASREITASLYAQSVLNSSSLDAPPVWLPNRVSTIDRAADLSSCTLDTTNIVPRKLTMVFNSRTDWEFYVFGPLPGDVLYDDTGTVFYVQSRTGTTVTAKLLNNYRQEPTTNVFALIDSIDFNTGTFYVGNTRLYTTPKYLRGDTAAASAVISNCATDDDVADYDAAIAVGDYAWASPASDNWVDRSVTEITARDETAGTITLDGTTGIRTETRKRLALFIRIPPANV